MQMQCRISDFNRRLERRAAKEVFEWARTVRSRIAAHNAAQETDTTAGIAVRRIRHFVVVEFATDFKGVLPGRVRDVIHNLRDRIGSLEFRPLESAETGKEISAKADAGQAASKGPAYTCIQTVRRSRGAQVVRQRRLVQAVVADARLVHPARTGSPDPVATYYLCSGVNRREPLLLQLGEVFYVSGIVSKKVGSADTVLIVQPVVAFADEIVDMHDVVKSVRDADGLAGGQGGIDICLIVRRESGTAAGDGPAREGAS